MRNTNKITAPFIKLDMHYRHNGLPDLLIKILEHVTFTWNWELLAHSNHKMVPEFLQE